MTRGQSRHGSAAEAVINVIVGYAINMTANALIFPLFGWQLSLRQNVMLGVFYTVISLVRSYSLRRLFNWIGFGRSKDAA
jgi:hypothetical protein